VAGPSRDLPRLVEIMTYQTGFLPPLMQNMLWQQMQNVQSKFSLARTWAATKEGWVGQTEGLSMVRAPSSGHRVGVRIIQGIALVRATKGQFVVAR
jgi:hypothetical protein